MQDFDKKFMMRAAHYEQKIIYLVSEEIAIGKSSIRH